MYITVLCTFICFIECMCVSALPQQLTSHSYMLCFYAHIESKACQKAYLTHPQRHFCESPEKVANSKFTAWSQVSKTFQALVTCCNTYFSVFLYNCVCNEETIGTDRQTQQFIVKDFILINFRLTSLAFFSSSSIKRAYFSLKNNLALLSSFLILLWMSLKVLYQET